MALSSPSYVYYPAIPNLNPYPNRRCLPCSSFLPAGLHSSSSSPFARDGFEFLAAQNWGRSAEGPKPLRRGHGLGVKALFGLGVPELVVIAGVTALIFGPKKLPEIGKSLGKTVKSFQQAAKEFETEVKQGGDSATADSSKPEALSATAVPEKEKENTEV